MEWEHAGTHRVAGAPGGRCLLLNCSGCAHSLENSLRFHKFGGKGQEGVCVGINTYPGTYHTVTGRGNTTQPNQQSSCSVTEAIHPSELGDQHGSIQGTLWSPGFLIAPLSLL